MLRYALFTVALLVLGTSTSQAGMVWRITDAGTGNIRMQLSGSLDLSGGIDTGVSLFPTSGFSGGNGSNEYGMSRLTHGSNHSAVVSYPGSPANPTDVVRTAFSVPVPDTADFDFLILQRRPSDFRIFDFRHRLRTGPVVFNDDFVVPVDFSSFIPSVSRYGDTSSPTAQGVTLIIGPATAVPEPTHLAMCSLGAIGLAASGIRRKRRAA